MTSANVNETTFLWVGKKPKSSSVNILQKLDHKKLEYGLN